MEKNVVYFKCVAVFGYSPNINKRGGDKGVGSVLSSGIVQCTVIVEPEYGSEELYDS